MENQDQSSELPPDFKFPDADHILQQANEAEDLRERRRERMLHEIAKVRWGLVAPGSGPHRLDNGEPMNFDKWAFQVEPFKCEAPEMTIVGSTGTSKSEWEVVNAIASAMCGLKVFQIFDTATKRDTFIGGRMDPVIHSVEFYREALNVAAENAGGESIDSKRFKHFGDGVINCVGSESPQDFYSHRADVAQVDEHQLCNLDNLLRIYGRMSDSPWKFVYRVGNPVTHGSPENRNIWYEFTQSDQRYWHVPCIRCHHPQILGWWSHFIDEIKTDTGAIIEVAVRDKTWDPNSGRDPRPVCTACGQLMVRLHPQSFWKPMNPKVTKHRGYQYSNLFSPETRITGLLDLYNQSLHDPRKTSKFWNDQLGLPYDFSGNSITEKMLEVVSTGKSAGVPPYVFHNASELTWRELSGA